MDCWTLTSSWSSVHCSLLYTLPNAQIMLCVYSIAYSTYKSCKSRRQQSKSITPFQILDSEALAYFTGDRNDFTIFETIAVPLSIHTTNGSTYITGKGSVTLRHLNDYSYTIATTLDNVFYCKDLICHLLSLGEFLQNSLSISGNRRIITVNKHNGAVFMTFKPRMSEDIIYVLQAIDWLSQQSTHLIIVIDYDTIYCHLGHLFWEALRRARKHVMDFFEV